MTDESREDVLSVPSASAEPAADGVESLEGAALDLAVARAAGVDAVLSDPHPNGTRSAVTFYSRGHDGKLDGRGYRPSEHWDDGGPIIERERIDVFHYDGHWWAGIGGDARTGSKHPTSPLIAAMRAFVASRATVSQRSAQAE